jgi:hypothetical protein
MVGMTRSEIKRTFGSSLVWAETDPHVGQIVSTLTVASLSPCTLFGNVVRTNLVALDRKKEIHV